MALHVGDEGRHLPEMFPARGMGTGVGLLSEVCPEVLVQDGLLPERLAALHTHIGLLPRVYPEVLVQDGALPERLATEGTVVRLVTRVDADVLLEVCGLAEQLATLGTHVGAVCAVGPLMLHQAAFQLEAFPTQVTLEGPVLLIIRVISRASVHRGVSHWDHGGQTCGMSPVFARSSPALVGEHDRAGQLFRGQVFRWRSEGKK